MTETSRFLPRYSAKYGQSALNIRSILPHIRIVSPNSGSIILSDKFNFIPQMTSVQVPISRSFAVFQRWTHGDRKSSCSHRGGPRGSHTGKCRSVQSKTWIFSVSIQHSGTNADTPAVRHGYREACQCLAQSSMNFNCGTTAESAASVHRRRSLSTMQLHNRSGEC